MSLRLRLMHFSEAVQREPQNAEDYAFLIYSLERCGKKPEAQQERMMAEESFGESGLPMIKLDGKPDSLNKYERVKRELDTTSLRLDLQDPRAQQHPLPRQTALWRKKLRRATFGPGDRT